MCSDIALRQYEHHVYAVREISLQQLYKIDLDGHVEQRDFLQAYAILAWDAARGVSLCILSIDVRSYRVCCQ